MPGEPESKRAKTEEPIITGWEDHTLNVSEALVKDVEGVHFHELVGAEVNVLNGLGPFSTRVLDGLGVQTIEELAKYKYFLVARAIQSLSATETKDGRLKGSIMNIDNALVSSFHTKSLKEICQAPTSALEGIGDQACELLETLGVRTVADLAEFKYCRWAEGIVQFSEFEEMKTVKERKVEAALRKLA